MMMSIVALTLVATVAQTPDSLPVEALRAMRIVVAEDASPAERYAAEEFATLMREAINASPLVVFDLSTPAPAVRIGAGACGVSAEAFGEEELRIDIRKDGVAIYGGRPRGTLYGVYEFFERYLGAEFLTYDHTYFPPDSARRGLPIETHTYAPPFSFRWSHYKENNDHPEFATRQRINTVATEARLGGKTPQNLIGHSYYKWITPELYAKSHPEYFALVDGVRKVHGAGGGAQPCVSNPEVIDIITRGVLDEIARNPGVRNIAVSQNDNGAYCRCATCEAINVEEGTPMAANLALVNAVAERVEKAYPDVKVGTLAYWYTRKPPKTLKPRANVQIQLCSIECCGLHAINDPACALNRSFFEDLEGWKNLSDEIWIWNYNTNFSYYDLPFPNLKSIGANVKFFLDSHAKGVFMQADTNGNSGEFCDLRNYVISKCLWRPGQDSWALAERFCRLHYGGAADEILAYLEMIHRNCEARGLHPDCGPGPERLGLTPEISREAVAHFERALALAEYAMIRARVEKASICAYKAMLMTGAMEWSYDAGAMHRVFSSEGQAVLDRYIALCHTYNMTMHSETVSLEQFLDRLRAEEALPAARIENRVWSLIVTPGHNGAAVSLTHKPTGRQMLRAMRNFNLEKGTIETFVKIGTYSRVENLECQAEATPELVKLTKALPGGTIEERTFRFDEAHPELLHVGFTLTEGQDATQAWSFVSQCGFDPYTNARDAATLSVYALGDTWQLVNRGWDVDHGPGAEVLRASKGGAIAFFNHEGGFGAIIRYQPDQVAEPFMYWHPERPQLNLEMRTPAVTLAPGQTLRLEYTIEHLERPPQ